MLLAIARVVSQTYNSNKIPVCCIWTVRAAPHVDEQSFAW